MSAATKFLISVVVLSAIATAQAEVFVLRSVDKHIIVYINGTYRVDVEANESVEIEVDDYYSGDIYARELRPAISQNSPPVTIAHFTLKVPMDIADVDFYSVSVDDGYNLAITISPMNPQVFQDCAAASCAIDLDDCPEELRITDISGAISACKAGAEIFQEDCPDAGSEYRCASDSYLITFA